MKAELLAPAGNYAKLCTAFRFGADAAYIGGKNFSLRTFADNFTPDEMKNAVVLAKQLGKKVYVTANIVAKNADFGLLTDYFKFLEEVGVDAAIVSDAGVVALAKKVAPNLPLHLSTQANSTNKYAVEFWKNQGVSRVILARELSIKEIEEIHDFVPNVELEAFVHGAMCISYSGRCLLSDYLDGRSSNRGACVQACRWKYQIRPVKPTGEEGEWLTLEQDDTTSYILNSKDLNLITHLTALEKAGVSSFKIEGRMKSAYYLATVINAYRRAMDGEEVSLCEKELFNVAHRDYTTAYALGKNGETVNYADNQAKGEYVYIADVLGYENGKVKVEMRNRFKTGDVLQILSPTGVFLKEFTVGEIFLPNGEKTDDAKLVQAQYVFDCPYELEKGDYLRRKNV